MPNENYTQICFIVDRSGSMASIANDMSGSFNSMIKEQKELEGKATVTLAQFDDEYQLVHDFIDIGQVEDLTIHPRNSTALLDAIGRTMNNVRGHIVEMEPKERPSKCIFIIITDGEENSSTEYNRDTVFQMIEDCKNDKEINYEFVFLGANQDAIRAGNQYGIRAAASLTYDASTNGTRLMSQSLSKSLSNYRSKASSDAEFSFSENDREIQEKAKNKYGDRVINSGFTDLIDNDNN